MLAARSAACISPAAALSDFLSDGVPVRQTAIEGGLDNYSMQLNMPLSLEGCGGLSTLPEANWALSNLNMELMVLAMQTASTAGADDM